MLVTMMLSLCTVALAVTLSYTTWAIIDIIHELEERLTQLEARK